MTLEVIEVTGQISDFQDVIGNFFKNSEQNDNDMKS